MSMVTAYRDKGRMSRLLVSAFCVWLFCSGAWSQVPPRPRPIDPEDADFDRPPVRDGSRPDRPIREVDRMFGPGGPGPQQKLKLVKQFDKDGDNRLDAAERKAAREFLSSEQA